MSFAPNSQLKSDVAIYLRDRQHAARLFVDDQFKFLPKERFLFHVSFGINSAALTDKSLTQKHRNEINMLVKSTDLPGYTMSTEVLNQYNRPKIVQYRHKTNDVTIKFHDDNYSLINKLWQNYYTYYYADTASASTGKSFERNAMRNFNYVQGIYGYKGNAAPFFTHITIYQLARHEYVAYKLINPIVTSWLHNKVDYSSKDSNDFDMKINYEAVAYSTGTVDINPPPGFGVEHYDQTQSPLTSLASSQVGINTPASQSSNLVTQQINSTQNVQSSTTTMSGLLGTNGQGVNGLQGTVFPGTVPNTTVTQATILTI